MWIRRVSGPGSRQSPLEHRDLRSQFGDLGPGVEPALAEVERYRRESRYHSSGHGLPFKLAMTTAT